MANFNAPNGLIPVRNYQGGGLTRSNDYRIASALAANIFSGDPVKSTGTTKQITVAAAGNVMLGVFNGCQYATAAGDMVFSPRWPTTTALLTGSECIADVYDDPFTLFECQVSGSAGLVAADIGAVADLTFATAGNASTGRSGVQVDQATIAQAGGDGVKIVDYSRKPDNALGQYCKALILISQHELTPAILVGV